MECPFDLPTEKEISTQDASGNNYYRIIDVHKHTIAAGLREKNAYYIVQAINSHEKLVEATEALVKDRDILQQDEGIFACQCLAKAPDDITDPPLCCYCLGKQTLKQAGRN